MAMLPEAEVRSLSLQESYTQGLSLHEEIGPQLDQAVKGIFESVRISSYNMIILADSLNRGNFRVKHGRLGLATVSIKPVNISEIVKELELFPTHLLVGSDGRNMFDESDEVEIEVNTAVIRVLSLPRWD